MSKEKLIVLNAKNLKKLKTDGNYRDINENAVLELIDSIKEIGIKEPITVKEEGEEYFLVNGYHRVEAARRIIASNDNYEISIPAIVMASEEDPFIRMVVANSLRSESVLDKARAAATLMERGKSIKQICDILGKERMTIDNWLRLNNLLIKHPEFVKKHADVGKDAYLYRLAARFARDGAIDIEKEESIQPKKAKTKEKVKKVEINKIIEDILTKEGIEKTVITSVMKKFKEATKA